MWMASVVFALVVLPLPVVILATLPVPVDAHLQTFIGDPGVPFVISASNPLQIAIR